MAEPAASPLSTQQPILALPGPTHWHNFAAGELLIAGRPLGHRGPAGTAFAVWDGAVAAAKHLEAAVTRLRAELPPGSTVLELGSGTGLAGLAAALALGLPVTLTDLPEVLPALQRNVALQPDDVQQLVSVAALDWAAPPPHPAAALGLPGPPALLLAADCVWLETLVRPFVSTLAAVAGPGSRTLLAHQSRSARVDAALWALLRAAGFEAQPATELPGEPARGRIELFWLRREAEVQPGRH